MRGWWRSRSIRRLVHRSLNCWSLAEFSAESAAKGRWNAGTMVEERAKNDVKDVVKMVAIRVPFEFVGNGG